MAKLIENFNANQVVIRPMQEDDVVSAVECFDDHYDVFDAPTTVLAFLRTYPESFFVATIPDLEQPKIDHVLGVCASPIGPQNTAFFGLYGLRVGYRSYGIGSRLFQRCLDYIGPNRSVGLYAVPDMRQKYMDRGGFTTREGVSMVNFVGIPSKAHIEKLKALTEDTSKFNAKYVKSSSKNVDETVLQEVINYDSLIQNEPREALLKNALSSNGYLTCAIFSGGQIGGESN